MTLDAALPSIDVHAHLLPEVAWEIPTRDGAQYITEHADGLHLGEVPMAVTRDALAQPRAMLEDMDRAGIDVRVVSAPPYAFPPDDGGAATAAYCHLVSDAIAHACDAAPDRLVPFGLVPLTTDDAAVAALDELAAVGARGVAVPPIVGDQPLGEGVGRAVLTAAERLGLAVLVHPVQAARPELGTHYLRNLVGNPYETTVAIASCALSGILEELPSLRVLFVHGGGCAPMIVGRWDHGWRRRTDVGVPGGKPPSEVLHNRVYVDVLAHHPSATRLTAEVFGHQAVTLGSDYPFDMGDPDAKTSAHDAGLEPRQLSRNAMRWLGGMPHIEGTESAASEYTVTTGAMR